MGAMMALSVVRARSSSSQAGERVIESALRLRARATLRQRCLRSAQSPFVLSEVEGRSLRRTCEASCIADPNRRRDQRFLLRVATTA